MFAIHFYGGSSWQGPWHAKLSNEPELTKTETRQTKLKSTNQPHLNLHMPCPSSSTNPKFNDNYTIHVPNLHKPASSVVQIHETHPSKRSQKLPPPDLVQHVRGGDVLLQLQARELLTCFADRPSGVTSGRRPDQSDDEYRKNQNEKRKKRKKGKNGKRVQTVVDAKARANR